MTRRRLLQSVTTIGLASLAGGVGTWSVFSDGEVSGVTLAAGTLDLVVEGGSTQTIRISGVEPGAGGTETAVIRNEGMIPGALSITLHTLACASDGNDNKEDEPCEWQPDRNNSEKEQKPTKSGKGDDLADYLKVRIGFDRDGEVGEESSILVDWTPVRDLTFGSVIEPHPSHVLGPNGAPNDDSNLFVQWKVPESVNDRIKSETLGFGITVHLEQA